MRYLKNARRIVPNLLTKLKWTRSESIEQCSIVSYM